MIWRVFVEISYFSRRSFCSANAIDIISDHFTPDRACNLTEIASLLFLFLNSLCSPYGRNIKLRIAQMRHPVSVIFVLRFMEVRLSHAESCVTQPMYDMRLHNSYVNGMSLFRNSRCLRTKRQWKRQWYISEFEDTAFLLAKGRKAERSREESPFFLTARTTSKIFEQFQS